MKTFEIDSSGSLTIKNVVAVMVLDGEESREVEQEESRVIAPEQLAVHLPMFISEIDSGMLLQIQTIIKGLRGV